MKNGYCSVAGAAINGIEAVPVQVEVSVEGGLPGMHILGMPDVQVLEARERVRYAIRSAGFAFPHNARIVVNLAPNSIRKAGSGFDLPIALGILVATEQVSPKAVEGRLFAGELGLDGGVMPVRGTVAYAVAARNAGRSFVGSADCPDVFELEGVEQLGAKSLGDFRTGDLAPLRPQAQARLSEPLDFADLAGHDVAKRGLQIAAAGGHGALIVGAPGSGKTMLALRMPSILPPLDGEERLQAALAHSAAGLPVAGVAAGERPMRMPHFSATIAGMIGGGNPVRPGEVTLAHGGILVLDDVAEFKPAVLQHARYALEQGSATIVRTSGITTFPARAQVVALANPCPCGYLGVEGRVCTCSPAQVIEYQQRVGGLVAGMVDMRIEMRPAKPSEFAGAGAGASSADYREGVLRARAFAAERSKREGGSEPANQVASFGLSDDAQAFIETAAKKADMTERGIAKTLKVARTIADLAESEAVETEHVAEALAFRL